MLIQLFLHLTFHCFLFPSQAGKGERGKEDYVGVYWIVLYIQYSIVGPEFEGVSINLVIFCDLRFFFK